MKKIIKCEIQCFDYVFNPQATGSKADEVIELDDDEEEIDEEMKESNNVSANTQHSV